MAPFSLAAPGWQVSFALILDQKGSKADMPPMIELSQEFGFDAAHYLGNGAAENRRLHGHSFYAEVTLRGEADPATGFLRDFGEVDAALKAIRETLDHRLLNEIEELGVPTLENLAKYIFVRAKVALPEVVRVKLRRPSYHQACVYEG
jgi:6-pyruvoyltetrahydropterin/6-carboxytetrahydropterin synthase